MSMTVLGVNLLLMSMAYLEEIPAYLHMEYVNRVCKEAICGLGISKTEKAIVHVGKSLSTVCPVLDQYDSENCVPKSSMIHTVPGQERDMNMVINELQKLSIFAQIDSRTFQHFPIQKKLLHQCDHSKTLQWMVNHIVLWQYIMICFL